MKLLWILLVIFAGLIVFFGMHKPASQTRPQNNMIQEQSIPGFDQPDSRIVEQKPSTHGYNNRVIDKDSEARANEAVILNK